MSHRHQKRLETCTGGLFLILYQLIQFSWISVKKISKNSEKSFVTILQRLSFFEIFCWKSKMPLKLCRITKFQEVLITWSVLKWRQHFMKYIWSHGNFEGFRTLLPTIVTWASLYCPSLNLNRPYEVKKFEKLNFLRFFKKKIWKKAEMSTFYSYH